MYANSFVTFIKQKRIIYKFFNSLQWINMKNTYIQNRNYQLNNDNNIEDILHMVIIPIFKEDPLIIDNTLKSLAEQNVSMIIGLALEERERHSDIKYNNIIHQYENKFLKIIKTIHPDGLKNEIAGKASNCSYCAQILVKYYENNLKDFYNYVMITSCDCDSIWCKDYFLYLNYLSIKNKLKYFNHIIYTPNITNFKNFQSNHILTNWISIIRVTATHGHFRCLGCIRCFTSEYHIPLKLLKRIDYWDNDLVHEDVHMRNKLAILDEKVLIFKSTFLPCDNQTPTDINSMYQTFILLWNQTLRWNFFIYDLYYLFHQLLLNLFNIKHYENFQTNSWKICVQIVNNYENLFYFCVAPTFNSIFWIVYLCLFNNYSYNNLVYYLLNYIQPYFIIIQIFLFILLTLFILNTNDENTKGELYHWKKHFLFILGLIIVPFFGFIYYSINLVFAWIQTLKSSCSHSDSALKMITNIKQK
ncbi:unnamed protein product [Rotaria sordida]|uniref:Glycosyltransferase 2-like domain-containing protein n=1 Tax=Rotaria sordida TaxID=392033 RepID=A0A815N147_9BILA|nr:unnamed protein product [Rotaria sordida]CAF4135623.1 unnamed protein product [Rotaria sordida]